jgi:uncharacterized membrane-anchored protein
LYSGIFLESRRAAAYLSAQTRLRTMMPIPDHPLRYATVNELHARPFPSLEVPSTAVYVAIKEPVQAQNRDRGRDLAHLLDLLDRHGSAHPQPGATHFQGPIGRAELKWESHTEFVTYTAFTKGVSSRPFDPAEAEVLPEDWLAAAPGKRLTSVLIRVEAMPATDEELLRKVDEWFVPESLAVSRVVDGAAVVAGDFRIDPAGHMRFAVFVAPGTGPRRVGRIVQRLCEIETYRAMSMLGLMRSRDLSGRLNARSYRRSSRAWTMPSPRRKWRCTICSRSRPSWKALPCSSPSASGQRRPTRPSSTSGSRFCGSSGSRDGRLSPSS